jgi:hypothetical protein
MMSDIMISGELAERLREAAQQAQLEVEEYLEQVLDRQATGAPEDNQPAERGTLGALLESAKRANLGAEEPDLPPPNTAEAHLAASKRANIVTKGPDAITDSGDRTWEDDWYDHLTRYRNEPDEA